jgi:uncharacterized membrane protein
LRTLSARRWVLLGVVAAALSQYAGVDARPIADVAGLWLVFGAPIAVWYGCAAKVVSTREAAVLVALGFTLVADMVELLALNTLLPMLGDPRPLARIPITATLSLCLIVGGALLPEADPERFAEQWGMTRRELCAVGGFGAVCLLVSVAGPVRINNGFSSVVSIAAMVCVAALLVVLLARNDLSLGAIELGLYCGALALLLLTSLRGWSITGHDIQHEYDYFQLAFGGERWEVRTYSNAYNACLSITLLPVALAKLTAVSGTYIFKVIIPVLFAAAPVMVFRAVRNVSRHSIAMLSAILFVVFPTYYTDMPYMGRQEIAFVLLGAAMLIVLERGERGIAARRCAFAALAIGTVLAHYSTAYIFVIVLLGAVCLDLIWRSGTAIRESRRRARSQGTRSRRRAKVRTPERSFASWWMIPMVAALALIWAGPATGTGGQLKNTLSNAVQELRGTASNTTGSSDTSYSIFGGATESNAQRLNDYRQQTLTQTAATRATGNYLPLTLVNQYQTPTVSQADLPLTSVGHTLQSAGVPVHGINALARSLVADLMQLLIALGLLAAWLRRRKGRQLTRDHVTLTFGALCMLAALTLVPQLSVDYSVLRGFQQGLFFFAPVMATGLIWMLSWAKQRTKLLTCVLVAVMMLDMWGVVPRLTGGYLPQLSLSDYGQYYDLYDPTVPEKLAAYWLENRIEQSSPNPRGVLVQTDEFTFDREETTLIGNVQATIYPTELNTYAYVFLGASTIRDDQATIRYRGNLVTYAYPTALLNLTFNEIYASDGGEIFQ